MKQTTFDAHNQQQITVEIVGPSFRQTIVGEGFFIIVGNGKHASFSKTRQDVCFGDITKNIIPDYTNQQYVDEYGDRLTGTGKTVKEYLQTNCRMALK